MLNMIATQAHQAISQLIHVAQPQPQEIVVIGCSTSAVIGQKIGTNSSKKVGHVLVEAILPILKKHQLFLASQCCEHLNRALIVEYKTAMVYNLPIVQAIPSCKAGGAFSTAVYQQMASPVTVENIQAHCGIDIGLTLIGMHLRAVAVPLVLMPEKIGEATVVYAKTRCKYIGGSRTIYTKTE